MASADIERGLGWRFLDTLKGGQLGAKGGYLGG